MSTQLALPIGLRDDATFDNFFPATNQQCVSALHACASGVGDAFIYIWGQQGSGRSHLLQAACHLATQKNRSSVYVPLGAPELTPQFLHNLEQMNLVCVDDIDAIAQDKQWEEALFHFYNNMREAGQTLLVAGRHPPQRLGLNLPDLASRLAWGVVFQLHLLADEDKLSALKLRAKVRGLALSDEVGQFLLRRCPRDMIQLFALLETLDLASLQAQRKLTIPFVKTV
ncbi:MAG TPA: DnaA regulatory inactivator Hda, partial [Gammaproteobacteria bacterium]|nr:DnaA regulatory inactivator Hda [Gammaproteobacteria bacterium]